MLSPPLFSMWYSGTSSAVARCGWLLLPLGVFLRRLWGFVMMAERVNSVKKCPENVSYWTDRHVNSPYAVFDTHVACMNTASLMRETRFTDDAASDKYARRISATRIEKQPRLPA